MARTPIMLTEADVARYLAGTPASTLAAEQGRSTHAMAVALSRAGVRRGSPPSPGPRSDAAVDVHILRLYAAGEDVSFLARAAGVSRAAIYRSAQRHGRKRYRPSGIYDQVGTFAELAVALTRSVPDD